MGLLQVYPLKDYMMPTNTKLRLTVCEGAWAARSRGVNEVVPCRGGEPGTSVTDWKAPQKKVNGVTDG